MPFYLASPELKIVKTVLIAHLRKLHPSSTNELPNPVMHLIMPQFLVPRTEYPLEGQ